MEAQTHGYAWRFRSDTDDDEYGVLVQCGDRDRPYWWLLCPTTATLYLDDEPDLLGCNDASCMWDDVHRKADEFLRHWIANTARSERSKRPTTPA